MSPFTPSRRPIHNIKSANPHPSTAASATLLQVQGDQHLLEVEWRACGDGCTPKVDGLDLATIDTQFDGFDNTDTAYRSYVQEVCIMLYFKYTNKQAYICCCSLFLYYGLVNRVMAKIVGVLDLNCTTPSYLSLHIVGRLTNIYDRRRGGGGL